MLHLDTATSPDPVPPLPQVPSNAAVKLKYSALLMTCKFLNNSPNGLNVEARALLDNTSSASFVSERLVQSLTYLVLVKSFTFLVLVDHLQDHPYNQSLIIQVKSMRPNGKVTDITAIIVPRVTCDLPVSPIRKALYRVELA